MNYSVKALNGGSFWVPGPEVYWMEGWGTREELNALIYLVRGGGRNILINTGPPQDLTVPNEGWEKLRLLPEEAEILPGLHAFWAGVHHRSSLAISIDTAKGPIIITDSFFKYGNIERGRYLGVMESMMEADATWARIRKQTRIFASIYDPEVFVRHSGGVLA